jgi:drug/metabolite transporter (DMT)-like permease
LGLLLISGAFWAIGVYAEIRALAFIDTSASGVIGSFRYVLACLIGQYFFKENFSFLNIIGACLIMLAVIGIGGLDFKKFNYRTGFLLQIFASSTQVIAYSLDKYLSASLSAELVTTCSYFFPALLFLILNPKKLLLIPSQIKLTKYWLCLIPIGVFLCYYALVKSFSIGGEFKIGMALVESSVVINWIFAYFLLKERNEAMQKLGFCVLCFLGICLITI